MYQNITMKSQHLTCYRHEDNTEFTILLSPTLMQVVDFSARTLKAYESDTPHAEYVEWKKGKLKLMGFRACTLESYVFAQDTLQSWTGLKEEIAPALPRGTHFNNFQLTKQLV